VNYFYPPTVYITHGLLNTLLGNARWVNDLREVLFSALLCWSLYYSASTLSKSRFVGVLSVVLLNCYPTVAYISHSLMLDFPLLSMVSVGVAALIWWSQFPSMKRT